MAFMYTGGAGNTGIGGFTQTDPAAAKRMQDAQAAYNNQHGGQAGGPTGYDNYDKNLGGGLARPNTENYDYGGTSEGTFQGLANAANKQQAPTWDMTNANASRAQAMQALGMSSAAANGDPNSIAQQQLRQGQAQGLAGIHSMAGSTRGGPQALAAAQAQGITNASQLRGTTSQNSAILGAQEQAAARDAYLQQAGQLRTQDTAGAQAMSTLAQQQTGINDAYATGLLGLGQNASMAQAQGGMAYGSALSSATQAARLADINRWKVQNGLNQVAYQNNFNNAMGALGAGSQALGTIATTQFGSGGGGGSAAPVSSGGGTSGAYGSPPALDNNAELYGRNPGSTTVGGF